MAVYHQQLLPVQPCHSHLAAPSAEHHSLFSSSAARRSTTATSRSAHGRSSPPLLVDNSSKGNSMAAAGQQPRPTSLSPCRSSAPALQQPLLARPHPHPAARRSSTSPACSQASTTAIFFRLSAARTAAGQQRAAPSPDPRQSDPQLLVAAHLQHQQPELRDSHANSSRPLPLLGCSPLSCWNLF